jgi:predicted dienelactone hydrolase
VKRGDLARDGMGLLGFGLLTGGITMLSVAAALIAAGLMLMAGAYLAARRG